MESEAPISFFIPEAKAPALGGEWRQRDKGGIEGMGKRVMDMAGHRYGRLTVIGRGEDRVYPSGRRLPRWRCVCDCGASVTVVGQDLRSGHTSSCGCLRRERAAETNRQRTGEAHPMFGRTGEANPAWKGNAVTYHSAHERVRRAKGSASLHECQSCYGSSDRMEWAYVGHCLSERFEKGSGWYCAGAHLDCYTSLCKFPCHAEQEQALRAAYAAAASPLPMPR